MTDTAGGLRVDRVRFHRDGALIIDGVDCTVPAGRVSALLGPNGAGKSTLLDIIAGLIGPDHGDVTLGGAPVSALRRRDRARRIALVEQHAEAEVDLTATDVVLLGRTPHLSRLRAPDHDDSLIVQQALEDAGATEFADRRFKTLSGGQRQRVLLAKALAQHPELLLLDEPTNHLDVGSQLDVLALMRAFAARGQTVLATVHDLSLAVAHADHVIVLSEGRVKASGPAGATLTPELIADVFGVYAEVLYRHDGTPTFAFRLLDRVAPR